MKKRLWLIGALLLVYIILIDVSGIGFTIKYNITGYYGLNSLGKISRRIEASGDCKVPFVCSVDEDNDKVIIIVDDGSQMKISGFSDADYENEFIRFKDKLEKKYKKAVEICRENICTDEGLVE